MEKRKIRELSPLDFIELCNEFYCKYRDVDKGLYPIIDDTSAPIFWYVLEPFYPPTDEGLYMFLRKATMHHIFKGRYHTTANRCAAQLEDPNLLGFSPAVGHEGGIRAGAYSFRMQARPSFYWTIVRGGSSYETLLSILSRAM